MLDIMLISLSGENLTNFIIYFYVKGCSGVSVVKALRYQ